MRFQHALVEELTTAETTLIGLASCVGIHVLAQLFADLELGFTESASMQIILKQKFNMFCILFDTYSH